MKQRKWYICALSWICAIALCLVTVYSPVQAEGKVLSDPEKVTSSSMTAGQKVTWDCVYFGSYPQTEIVSRDDTTQLSKLESMNNYFETKYEEVSADQFKDISGADYENDEATVNGVKYRRMKKTDAVYSEDNSTSYYKWVDSDTYHYFRYEPVKWRVLRVNGEKALLLSDVAVDDVKYNISNTSITWEKSTIRSWLNNYGSSANSAGLDYSSAGFMSDAFSGAEQKAIINKDLENEANSVYGTTGGNSTQDKIFLLSESEIQGTSVAVNCGFAKEKTLWDEARRSKTSTYAFAKGVWRFTKDGYAGNCGWWLRSPGSNSAYAVGINGYGWDYYEGGEVTLGDEGVRPALYINLSDTSVYSYAGTVCSDGTVKENGGTSDKTDGTDKKDESGKTDNSGKNNSGKTDNSGSGSSVQTTALTQIITASSRTVVYKSKAFNINARTNGGGKLTYVSSNKKVAAVSGTGRVTVKGYGQAAITIKAAAKGQYKAASKKITVTVIPKGVTLKKVLSPARRAIKIKWKKTKGIDGYNIWFSTKKNFKSSTWQRTLKKSQNTLSTVGLPAKKTCYVKIRSYKKVGKKKYYSKWSKIKTVRIK